MKKLLAILLAVAVTLLPTNPTLAHERSEASFKQRLHLAVTRADEREIKAAIREHFQIPADADVSVEYVVQPAPVEEADDVQVVLPQPHPELGLGCVLIVIVVTVVFFGVLVYIVYQACKPAPGQPTPPPPPPPPGTNTGPNTFYMAGSHSGRVGTPHP